MKYQNLTLGIYLPTNRFALQAEINGQTETVHIRPPKLSISDFMGYLNGKSTLMISDRHSNLQSKWNKAFGARGYYAATIGNVTEEAIKKYITEQSEESRKEDSEGAAF